MHPSFTEYPFGLTIVIFPSGKNTILAYPLFPLLWKAIVHESTRGLYPSGILAITVPLVFVLKPEYNWIYIKTIFPYFLQYPLYIGVELFCINSTLETVKSL
jgi:hypothetical protein